MPGSVSSAPESPKILTYVGSVGFLVLSLMLTAFGYTNNAWIVMSRPNEQDEFQRGVRDLDCYKTYHPENITCLPWGHENKTDKFPYAFKEIYNASILVYIAYYLALIIIASQIFWLFYTIGQCCSLKFCQRVENYKLIMFHVMITTVGVWIILFAIFIFETFTDSILPPYLKKPEYVYSIGLGCWIFFLGGVIPFVIALYCLFNEQMQQSQDRLRQIIRNRRQRVPTTDPHANGNELRTIGTH